LRNFDENQWVHHNLRLFDHLSASKTFANTRSHNFAFYCPNRLQLFSLAYTAMGGSALYIETQGIKRGLDENGKTRGGGSLKATGNLKDVMKESSQIAFTVARARLAEIDPNNDYFDKTDIHMHVPEGATPKDGKSLNSIIIK